MKKTDIKTTTFETGYEDFMVDIVEKEDAFDVYLYRGSARWKDYLFGLSKKYVATLDLAAEIVEGNLLDYVGYHFYDQKTDTLAKIDDIHNTKMMED